MSHSVPLCPPDIRDTVNYKEVMKQYGLGPNGGIVTSLNLFATRFDQVILNMTRMQTRHLKIGSFKNQRCLMVMAI